MFRYCKMVLIWQYPVEVSEQTHRCTILQTDTWTPQPTYDEGCIA